VVKVKCQRCGWRYNPELLDTCPLCEVRQEAVLEQDGFEATDRTDDQS